MKLEDGRILSLSRDALFYNDKSRHRNLETNLAVINISESYTFISWHRQRLERPPILKLPVPSKYEKSNEPFGVIVFVAQHRCQQNQQK